jgi:flagellar basal-body rod protein FlgF
MESLEMLANNIANAATPGFKADREFYSTYYAPEAFDGPAGTLPVASPVIEKNWTDFGQGVNTATGNSLDLAISGAGFFAVQSPNGIAYTRNGSFRISSQGNLVTSLGDTVLAEDGNPIRLNPGEPVSVDQQGVIAQEGKTIAQLRIVDISVDQLAKLGTGYFRYVGSVTPGRAASHVEQGRLENANLQPAEAAVRLVSVMRQFEMLQRALNLGAEMNRRSVEEVARVKD